MRQERDCGLWERKRESGVGLCSDDKEWRIGKGEK